MVNSFHWLPYLQRTGKYVKSLKQYFRVLKYCIPVCGLLVYCAGNLPGVITPAGDCKYILILYSLLQVLKLPGQSGSDGSGRFIPCRFTVYAAIRKQFLNR